MKRNYQPQTKYASITAKQRRRLLIVSVIVTLSCFVHTVSYGQGWEWAKSVGDTAGSFTEEAMSVATSGHYAYITGQFDRPAITFGATTLTNANPGFKDVFLAKYDSAGNVIWAKSGSGYDDDLSNSVTTDLYGNVYITGVFGSATITFGAFTLINAGGGYNMFFVKYDSFGNVIWARSEGGSEYDEGRSVATDLSGNIYVTGFFRSPAITFGATTLTNAGHDDVFLVKYDTAGNALWARSAGDSDYEYATSVSTDLSDGVYITGFFQSPALTFGTDTLTNSGSTGNVFIVKYDTSGAEVWAKSSNSSIGGIGSYITAHSYGSVYVTGYFTSPSISFDTFTLTNASGNNDLFIVKYDSLGNALWAKRAGGTGQDYAYTVATDASGNVYLTGTFQSPAITFGTTTLTNAGMYNMFLTKYSGAGNVIWAKSAGGSSIDEARSVAADLSGSMYITGYYGSPVLTFGATTLTCADWPDIFLAKYDSASSLHTTAVIDRSVDFVLYPNPVINELTVISPIPITQITITNLLGQTLLNEYHQNKEVSVDISHLANGIYFIKVNGTLVKKFVKD